MAALLLGTLGAFSLQLAVLALAAWLAARAFHLTPEGRQVMWRLVVALALASVALTWMAPAAPSIARHYAPVAATVSAFSLRVVQSRTGTAAAPALLGIVALGAVARIAWLVASAVSLRRFRRVSAESVPVFERLRDTLAVDARLVSGATRQPFTFGLRRPVVVVPDDFLERPADVQRGVLVHELVHVRRGDWRTACVEQAFTVMAWFHPATWIIVGELRQAREELVDRESARIVGSRRTYLQALLEFSTAVPSPGHALAFLRSRQLVRRVTALTMETPMSTCRSSLTLAAALVALGTASISAHAWFPVPTQPRPSVVAVDHDEPLALDVRVRVDPGTTADAKVVNPVPIKKANAVYPEDAKKQKVQGTVVVRLKIGTDGLVKDARIVKSIKPLDQATLDAVKQWTFKPGTVDGKPVEVETEITVNFTLK
jgi:TonB family protein